MPLLETKGAGSAQGFGLTLQQATPVYIEEVFSTWVYTGNGSTQTITNGIDLSTKGGLVWCKYRNGGQSHGLFDTARGASNVIYSNLTNAQASESGVTAFNTTGFSLGSNSGYNANTGLFVSWTFRKQPKFFDVVTYTGTGSVQNIAHNLGSVPGCIIVKSMTDAVNWNVYHRSVGSGSRLILNTTDAALSAATTWNNTDPTSTQFTVGTSSQINFSGSQYVAYLFAHNAGGFGLTGTDNVITCGSFTTDASGQATVNLGYEPQWLLVKNTAVSSVGSAVSWNMTDNMRGMPVGFVDPRLFANTTDTEDTAYDWVSPTATGFIITPDTASGDTYGNSPYIYIAIRRGPMKTPTTGTSVFSPNASSASGGTLITTNFPIDLQIQQYRLGAGANWYDRLRSISSNTTASGRELGSAYTGGEASAPGTRLWGNTGFTLPGYTASAPFIYWNFRRAPGFFDEVCYTGNGSSSRTLNHNLGVAPELWIVKSRSNSSSWLVGSTSFASYQDKFMELQNTNALQTVSSTWNAVTSTTFGFGSGLSGDLNASGWTYVTYLFASCPGVSKVGSYTGTGALQTIDCGFTGGARFVLIKRTNSTGDWFVYDSARGLTSGNDPYLLLNSTAAEDTGTNYVDTTSVGFQVTAAAPAGLNASGSTYIFLAIA